ncbi:hypothetical protein KUC3_21310 [Alteromonas sp. KC3]|uniref:hypothetical protein n=1 Tax=unclassified Alteromonas TaxID=2614992 RepID=UPI001921F4BA|nr:MULTISPECIES: hypothetical protein [unclassified Alteromonas]BCO19274.1 hypothetical protein KUC3_21310 [Alteromonas sp. KC3]BCO23234.1 hypothetical protein KUC14_21030 [Alteromonas sp. KC14]
MNKMIGLSLLTIGCFISTTSLANQLSSDFLKNEIELAHTQYLNGSPESGLYALQALARMLESDDSSSSLGPNNLSFTYLRIGLLYEQAGSQAKANAYFNKALSAYIGEDIEIAHLKEAVSKLDEKRS